MGNRCLYENDISAFLDERTEVIRDALNNRYHGIVLTTTREAWSGEIEILKKVLVPWKNSQGRIIFEYDIPRLGKRIDVVLLLKGIIFVLEFKVGESDILIEDREQVLDYALDLRNFHKLSQNKVIAPILVATKSEKFSSDIKGSAYDDYVLNPLVTGEQKLAELISKVLSEYPDEEPVSKDWIISPYSPTPTIIEAKSQC